MCFFFSYTLVFLMKVPIVLLYIKKKKKKKTRHMFLWHSKQEWESALVIFGVSEQRVWISNFCALKDY